MKNVEQIFTQLVRSFLCAVACADLVLTNWWKICIIKIITSLGRNQIIELSSIIQSERLFDMESLEKIQCILTHNWGPRESYCIVISWTKNIYQFFFHLDFAIEIAKCQFHENSFSHQDKWFKALEICSWSQLFTLIKIIFLPATFR